MSTPISTPDLLAYDEGPTIIGLCAAMMSAVVIALRVWARRRMKMPLEWDDWLIVMSLVGKLRTLFNFSTLINY